MRWSTLNQHSRTSPSISNRRSTPHPSTMNYVSAGIDESMFRNPNLVRARLSHLDFTMFRPPPWGLLLPPEPERTVSRALQILGKESAAVLEPLPKPEQVVASSESTALYAQSELPSILSPIKDALRVSKSDWGHIAPLTEENADFRD